MGFARLVGYQFQMVALYMAVGPNGTRRLRQRQDEDRPVPAATI